MPSLAGIQTKIDNASNKYLLKDRDIYKRITIIDSVDEVLESSSNITTNDTLLSPPPFYSRPDKIELGGFRAPSDVLSPDGSASLSNVEYILFCSTNTLTLDDIQNPKVTIVFKDAHGNEEEFRITDYESVPFQGSTAALTIYIKSFQKQTGTMNNGVGG